MSIWCLHDWRVTSVQPIDIYSEFGDGKRPIRTKTDVSMICKKCGWPRIKTMRGEWTP